MGENLFVMKNEKIIIYRDIEEGRQSKGKEREGSVVETRI